MERFRVPIMPVQRDDWSGSASLHADDYAAFYALARLNPEEWLICGIEIYGGGERSAGAVLAVSTDVARSVDDLSRAAMENGGVLSVTRFDLLAPPWGPGGFRMLKSFRRWSLQATHVALLDQEIEIAVEEPLAAER